MLLVKPDADPFENEIHGTLRNFATELRELENALLEADERHPHHEILQACEDAAEFLPRLRSTLREHVSKLDAVIGERDPALPKPALKSPLLAAADPTKPPRDACSLLRDYCAHVHLVAMGYTMLHARSVALHDVHTAKLALSHLQELVPFVHRMCETAPRLAVQELTRHFGGLIPGAAETAVRNTQDAWSQHELAGSVH